MVRFAFMASLTSEVVGGGGANAESQQPLSCGNDWQAALACMIRDPVELCRLLELDPALAAEAQQAAAGFPLLVSREYVARIHSGDPQDPLLRQILPRAAETATVPGFRADPLREVDAAVAPGLLSKYHGRSLIVTTPGCGVHCRFCFRRHFPFSASPPGLAHWEPAVRQIAADPSIHEVILSGGDPLTLPDDHLAKLTRQLAQITHLRRLRLHTRMPVMIPQRVTDEMLGWLRATRLSPVVVVQVNHPAEIDPAVAKALGRMVDAGVPVLCQSVLLRGVNDRLDVLAELYERLIDLRVIPYYLHQLDRVAGAAHFEVPEPVGVSLIEQLRVRLPGYAVPRYVRQPPAGPAKECLV